MDFGSASPIPPAIHEPATDGPRTAPGEVVVENRILFPGNTDLIKAGNQGTEFPQLSPRFT